MSNLSLYSVTAALILDSEGKRLYANYYKPLHSNSVNDPTFQIQTPYPTLKSQETFESNLFAKTYKSKSNIIIFDDQIVVYKAISDVVIYIIGSLQENEAMLYQVLTGLTEALEIVLKDAVDKKSISENYDYVALAIDETLDDGIILETDGNAIASRVTKRPLAENTLNIELNERGLFNAFQFAKKKVKGFNF